MTLNEPETKIAGFSEVFAILGCNTHLHSEFAPKLLHERDQDNLRMKLN